MGHYDSSRPGYCGKCGAGPGNMRVDGSCPFCVTERNVGTPTKPVDKRGEGDCSWCGQDSACGGCGPGQRCSEPKATRKPSLAEKWASGQKMTTGVDLAEAELRLLAKPFQTPPVVIITSDGTAWGRVSDEQVLVLLEQAAAEVKRRNGWQS